MLKIDESFIGNKVLTPWGRHGGDQTIGENFSAIHRASEDRYSVEMITDERQFSELADQWNMLTEHSQASVFQTFDWMFTWWKHFGEGEERKIHILLIRCRNQLVGIAPFFIQFSYWKKKPLASNLRVIGCGVAHNHMQFELFRYYAPSDYLDIIAKTSFESVVAEAVADHITKSAFDEIEFNNIPENGILFKYVIPRIEQSSYREIYSESEECPRLRIGSDRKAVFQTMNSGIRRKMQQARKTFSEKPLGVIESLEQKDKLPEAITLLVQLHQKRWTKLGFPGVFSDKRYIPFMNDIAGLFNEKKWLWFKIACYNGEAVAARMVFRFHGCMYDYLAGLDLTLTGANRRPGLALLAAMIDEAQLDRISIIDLLRGREGYKLDLTSESLRIWNIRYRNRQRALTSNIALATILRYWYIFLHLLSKELYLLGIQYRQRGALVFLFFYLKLLFNRCALKKLSN